MDLILRRTPFLDGKRRTDHCEVRCQGRTVGRIHCAIEVANDHSIDAFIQRLNARNRVFKQ
jgi:hypothetical protein